MCVSPVRIPLEKVLTHVFNEGKTYKTYKTIYVPCGKCPECLKARQSEWYVRFFAEDRYWRKLGDYRTLFFTLTYSNDNLPESRERALKDIQAFVKQVRRKLSKDIRFYIVSENGSNTNRLHYHGLFFKVHVGNNIKDTTELIRDCWHRGFINVKYAVGQDYSYVSKYVTKDVDVYKKQNSWRTIQVCSKRPALGLQFFQNSAANSYYNSNIDNLLRIDGYDYSLPRYIGSKVYTPENLSRRKADFCQSEGIHERYVELDNDKHIKEDVEAAYDKKCRSAGVKKMKRIFNYEKFSECGVEADG